MVALNLVNRPNKRRQTPDQVSELTTNRLSIYLRCLNELDASGVQTISSQGLAEQFHLNAAQIRKDLAYFGEFGVRGWATTSRSCGAISGRFSDSIAGCGWRLSGRAISASRSRTIPVSARKGSRLPRSSTRRSEKIGHRIARRRAHLRHQGIEAHRPPRSARHRGHRRAGAACAASRRSGGVSRNQSASSTSRPARCTCPMT